MLPPSGQWLYSLDHGQPCQVIEAVTIWGESTCRVWLPEQEGIVRVSEGQLVPLDQAPEATSASLSYAVAAARVSDALTQDVLLAPIESSVIPLPHQISALARAISGDRVRYLLADEVGLGKTIEAGLILRELKLRGLVSRTLVIAPKGLVTQWVAEMQNHFGEHFQLVLPSDLRMLRGISAVTGSELRVQGSGLRVAGSGFRVEGSGLGVAGSGSREAATTLNPQPATLNLQLSTPNSDSAELLSNLVYRA